MSLDRSRRDWTTLGARDPLWAVLVTPRGRRGGWDRAAFLATGRDEVSDVLDRVRGLGLRPGHDAAMDFGSGAGRLTLALREHFARVVGVDVSAPMVEHARTLDVGNRCEFVLNHDADLRRWADGSFDLAYSSLVLQHLPTAAAVRYLGELVRLVRRGGVVVVQVATRPGPGLKGRVAALLPRSVMRFVQRSVLRYPAPLDMYPMSRTDVETAVGDRGRVAAAWDEPMYGGHWIYTRYVIERT